MSWLEKLMPSRIRTDAKGKRGVPEGLWSKCPGCKAVLYRAEMADNLEVCPKCGTHMRIEARCRLECFLDAGSQNAGEGASSASNQEIGALLRPVDILGFHDNKPYSERLQQAQEKTGEADALIMVQGCLKGMPVVVGVFNFAFMGGSMGSVVGERFVRGVDTAIEQGCPLICFSASGGARMQEALFSLLQMAKTSAALKRLSRHGLPFISVLTDPTMGGVSASLAMLGDVNIAEPGALIGFAGPRVIEQTVREKLPEGFQRSEFLLEHGALDMIVDRREMRARIAEILGILMRRPACAGPYA